MRRSTTARGTPIYGTRRMRWRANSRQMTRPSRRRSEETMNERPSSCVRAPHVAPLPRRQPVGRHREQRVHVGRGLAVRTEGKSARLAKRAQPVEDGVGARRAVLPVRRARRREVRIHTLPATPALQLAEMVLLTTNQLGGLIASFSVTHIGLSAIREPLIDGLGAAAGRVGSVGLGISLPSIWLADSSGLEVWPNEATAGRQLYRAGYTAVSSALLFPALAAYPEARAAAEAAAASTALSPSEWWLCFAAATGAQAISIASLLNPSPLSLVPGFEADETALGGIKRDDRRKLRPYGLTRITRHPLVLPVVPWGAANALLAGAQ